MIARRALPVLAMAAMLGGGAIAASNESYPGVSNPAQARVDYILKCQGCHRPDGSGDAKSNPPMNGIVARFLHVPGGRDYLGRVPGVATVNLDDARLADLLNWTLYRFDRANVPPDFKPYAPAEIGRLRKAPLRTDAAAERRALIRKLEQGQITKS